MTCTLEQLSTFADAGISVSISARDLLNVIDEVTKRDKEDTFVPVTPDGMRQYRACQPTIVKRIQEGIYRGYKNGLRWYVYTAEDHARRMRQQQRV